MSTYKGRCHCKSVEFEVAGQPVLPPHLCHCTDCRVLANSFTGHSVIYRKDAVKVTTGQDKLIKYESTPDTIRPFCNQCGTHIYKEATQKGIVIIYPNLFDIVNEGNQLPEIWQPKRHIYYRSRMKGYEYNDNLEFYDHAPKVLNGDDVQVDYKGSKL